MPGIDWLEYRWLALLGVVCVGAGAMIWMGVGIRVSALVTFDLATSVYLGGMIFAMSGGSAEAIRRHAKTIDAGRWSMLTISVLLSATVLAALGMEIRQPENVEISHLVLASVSILVSWLFMNTMFAMHYAHTYYDESRGEPGGLAFPGERAPEYLRFSVFRVDAGDDLSGGGRLHPGSPHSPRRAVARGDRILLQRGGDFARCQHLAAMM